MEIQKTLMNRYKSESKDCILQEEEYKEEIPHWDVQSQSFTKEMFIEEMKKWKQDKCTKIENFLNKSGYYRIFIKPQSIEVESLEKKEEVFLLNFNPGSSRSCCWENLVFT